MSSKKQLMSDGRMKMNLRDKVLAKTKHKRSIDEFESLSFTGFELNSSRITEDLPPYIQQHRVELAIFSEFKCREDDYAEARIRAERHLAHIMYGDQLRLIDKLISAIYGGKRDLSLEIAMKLEQSMRWD